MKHMMYFLKNCGLNKINIWILNLFIHIGATENIDFMYIKLKIFIQQSDTNRDKQESATQAKFWFSKKEIKKLTLEKK